MYNKVLKIIFLSLNMKITKQSIRYFTLLKLPLVYFSGIRITNINADGVEASVKLKWINQNPFRSMFWAVQGMAAELTRVYCLCVKLNAKSSVSMLLIETKASFSKKAKGKFVFLVMKEKSKNLMIKLFRQVMATSLVYKHWNR